MDKLIFCPTSSGSPSSAASLFSEVGGGTAPVLEFMSCDDDILLEKWLLGTDDHGLHGGGKHLLDDAATGSRSASAGNNVEAERQRRDKLNRLFCDLRGAVPTVSRMDKASLLADATTYIAELRGRIEKLDAEAKKKAAMGAATEGDARNRTAPAIDAAASLGLEEKLEVRVVAGQEKATLRLTSAARHAPARLMEALRLLDLPVMHASVCRAGEVTVLDTVVDVPAGPLLDEAWLRAALLCRLQGNGCRRNPILIN